MKVTFFSNFLNHHQTPFCDELYSILGDKFTFVSTTEKIPESYLQNGYPDCTGYSYNLKSYKDEISYNRAMQLGIDSDIVIIGSAPKVFTDERIKQNKHTFRYSERFLKTGIGQLLNPSFLRGVLLSHTIYRKKNLYMLCASAYMANDLNLILAYPQKKFKWGYFTKTNELDIKQIITQKPIEKIELLWTSRFISWKHPELAVRLCNELKKKGYNFHLNMIGKGVMLDPIKKLIEKMMLQDCIDILPGMPNSDVHKYMSKANIFLFTSNREEGWGAVLNEAMSNGCAVVASHTIGAVPFLINLEKNGLIYKSGSLVSILRKTEKLMNNISLRNELGINAYYTLRNEWSPERAASNFLKLAKSFLEEEMCHIDSGPCSAANNIKGFVHE